MMEGFQAGGRPPPARPCNLAPFAGISDTVLVFMSSRKRAATSGSTPVDAKQRRAGAADGDTPATAPRPHGRVVLNVGGKHFESSRSTLEGSSSYFRSLLSRWDEADSDEPLFIDCDADAFGVLLSHMRIASNVILPKGDDELCARVLIAYML